MQEPRQKSLMAKCDRCKLCQTAKTIRILGTGPKKCKVMIVGEAPGANEDSTGEPFVGQSGKLLNNILKEVGLSRKKVYITNAVHCRPPDNRTPSKVEIRECKHWLDHEIKKVKPKYVLLLGNTPLESITGKKGIKKARGTPIELGGIIYMPTYHPAFAIRDNRMEPVLRADVTQFADIIKRGGLRKEKKLRMRIVTNENLATALRDISRTRVKSFDTETSGLDPFAPGSWVTSIGVGTRRYQWCFPLQHTQGQWFNNPRRQRSVVKKLGRALKGGVLVAHNGKFDTKWIAQCYGEWWHVDFDTMLAHYNLNENSLHGLDILAQRYFDAMNYDIPLAEKHGFGPLDRHCEYLGLDIYYTRKLYFRFKKRLKEDEGTESIFYKLTMPVSRMYAETESLGIYVDPDGLKKAQRYWSKRADRSLKKLNKLCPSDNKWKNKKTKEWEYGVNWNSPDQVAEMLFDQLGLKSIKETPGGKRSTDESVLLRLADKHPVPKLILKNREATKNLSTFIHPWQRRSINNRIHPNFKIHGTVTGRPSCEEPNLQQVPRNPKLRNLFTAPKGWTLVSADFSQVELRIVAEMSRDPALVFAYQTGGDVHTKTVQTIFGIMKPTKEERKRGKAINFGFIYGMWWKKFKDYARDSYGVDFTDAESKFTREGFFKLYAGLVDWHKKQKRFARRYGYVRSLLGRMRRLPDAMAREDSPRRQEAERQSVNSPVQSFASDMNLMSAVELSDKLPREYFRIVSTTHDEILAEVRNDMLEEVAKIMKQVMEDPQLMRELKVELSIPIIAELEGGPWGGENNIKLAA